MTPTLQEHEITLYRKYRPQHFSDVKGQDHVVSVLSRALAEQRTAHAYLFAGPRGTGKTTIARLLAKRLNCLQSQEAEPCDICVQCIAFNTHASLDLIEIDAASNRGIDEIRELKERIRLAPAGAAYKVYIIDEVHMLTKEAFNALLKTLEEPPSHAVFILATTELHKVPDTIRSRCQTFLFRRAPIHLLQTRLRFLATSEGVDIDDAALLLLAHHSEGCFRDAESLLGQVLGMQEGAIHLEDVERFLGVSSMETIQQFIHALFEKNGEGALRFLQESIEKGFSIRRFLDDAIRYLRAIASFAVAGVHSESYPPAIEEALQKQASMVAPYTPTQLLRLFVRAKGELRDALLEELPLEMAIFEWCGQQPTQSSSLAVSQPAVHQQRTPPPALTKVAVVTSREPAPVRVTEKPPKEIALEEKEDPALLTAVLSAWPEFLLKSRAVNPLLSSTLDACAPVMVRGNTLFLVTAFSLYQERLKDVQLRSKLEDLLKEISSVRVLLRVVHEKEAKTLGLPAAPEKAAPQQKTVQEPVGDIVEDAITMFGGEVLEKTA